MPPTPPARRATPPPTADVLVVGGGPAGSATARLLSALGWSVTVLERSRFPRAKACGECLNPGALATLRRMGLLERVEALSPAVLEGWQVRAGSAVADAPFPLPVGDALAVPRSALDAALLEAAREAGARVEEGVRVRSVGSPDRGCRALAVTEPDGTSGERRGRVVVGADGLRSVVARAIGAPRRRPHLRKLSLTARVRGRRSEARRGLLVLTPGGTVGLAPVRADGDLWNLTVVVDAVLRGREVRADPLRFLLSTARAALPAWSSGPRVVDGPWASGPFDWPMRTVVADRLLLAGDAAGYYDPLTGQGIFRALRSAELAADAIDSALRRGRVSGADLRSYRLRHRAEFAPGRLIQRAVEWVVSRDRVRESLVARLAARPSVMSTLIAVTGDAAPASSLLRPGLLAAAVLPVPVRRLSDGARPSVLE